MDLLLPVDRLIWFAYIARHFNVCTKIIVCYVHDTYKHTNWGCIILFECLKETMIFEDFLLLTYRIIERVCIVIGNCTLKSKIQLNQIAIWIVWICHALHIFVCVCVQCSMFNVHSKTIGNFDMGNGYSYFGCFCSLIKTLIAYGIHCMSIEHVAAVVFVRFVEPKTVYRSVWEKIKEKCCLCAVWLVLICWYRHSPS